MTEFGYWAIGTGVVYLLGHMALVVTPGASRRALAAFPRHAWLGRILALVALAWSVRLAMDMPMGFVEPYKRWFYVLGPVVYLLTVKFMDELLAARAFGGLLLLIGEPILAASREPGLAATRLVLVTLVYVWVVAGMALVLGPYWFRIGVERVLGTDARCRVAGAAGVLMGLVLLALGATGFAR